MEILTVYLRCAEIYNKDVAAAALVDSCIATKVLEQSPIEAFTIGPDKAFHTGSKLLTLKHPAEDVVIIGTVPYHLLIANLYHLVEQGRRVKVNPKLLITEKENPDYPEEFLAPVKG